MLQISLVPRLMYTVPQYEGSKEEEKESGDVAIPFLYQHQDSGVITEHCCNTRQCAIAQMAHNQCEGGAYALISNRSRVPLTAKWRQCRSRLT